MFGIVFFLCHSTFPLNFSFFLLPSSSFLVRSQYTAKVVHGKSTFAGICLLSSVEKSGWWRSEGKRNVNIKAIRYEGKRKSVIRNIVAIKANGMWQRGNLQFSLLSLRAGPVKWYTVMIKRTLRDASSTYLLWNFYQAILSPAPTLIYSSSSSSRHLSLYSSPALSFFLSFTRNSLALA